MKTEWVAFLDDDDVMFPNHLEELACAAALNRAQVAYSRCVVDGTDWQPVQPFDPDKLQHGNFIPATVLMRTDWFRRAGGFPQSSMVEHGWEDWALWKNLLARGARFAFVDKLTWRYRLHPGSKTHVGEAGAT